MKSLGLLFVVAVFGIAMTALVYHYAPGISETAVKLPTHQADGWKVNAGYAVSWSMIGVSSK